MIANEIDMNEYVSRIRVVSIDMAFASLIEVSSKCSAKNDSKKVDRIIY